MKVRTKRAKEHSWTAEAAVRALLEAVAHPPSDFFLSAPADWKHRLAQTPIGQLRASEFLSLAVEIQAFLAAPGTPPPIGDVVLSLLGPELVQERFVGKTDKGTDPRRMGLIKEYRGNQHPHRFHIVGPNVLGARIFAYFAVIYSRDPVHLVFHPSYEFFLNLSQQQIRFEYVQEQAWSHRRTEALRRQGIAPQAFILFDGRAPHRHVCELHGQEATAFVLQLPGSLPFRKTAAFVMGQAEKDRNLVEDNIALSRGAQEHLEVANLIGNRIAQYRRALGFSVPQLLAKESVEVEARGSAARHDARGDSGPRVRMARFESGSIEPVVEELLSIAHNLDLDLREVFCYQDEVVLCTGTTEGRAGSLLSQPPPGFASSSSGVYDVRILFAKRSSSADQQLVSMPGDLVILPLHGRAEVEVALTPLCFERLAVNGRRRHGGFYHIPKTASNTGRTARMTIESTSDVSPESCLHIKSELPHRILMREGARILVAGPRDLLELHSSTIDKSPSRATSR